MLKPPPESEAPVESLAGSLEHITFHSEESGFSVLKVRARGHRDPVTVVGVLSHPVPGEWVEATGAWVMDPRHGRQFKATSLASAAPASAKGLERYLASGLVKGIGPALAERLVAAFGEAVLTVIEKEPHRLRGVEGIGPVRLERIRGAWQEQKAVRSIMVFLHSQGVGTSRAYRIYKTYGEEAIAVVREDPYRLAREVWGIGFKTADAIAAQLGIDPQSPRRARAGVEFTLQELTGEGHCAYPAADLVESAARRLQIDAPLVEAAVQHGIAAGRLVRGAFGGKDLIYLADLDAAEEGLARDLVRLSASPHPCPPVQVVKAIAWVEEKLGLHLAPTQREAVRQAVTSKVMVITGGPGVGKTTLVNALVQIFQAKKLAVVLGAPTGRAAKRLSETSGQEAKTLHRLLAFDPQTGRFRHDASNPLEGDVFVVDETSMIDLVLAHQLVTALPPGAVLLLVGDVDQLPSVGPGCVLRDIIAAGVVPVCRLTEIFRQAESSHIITNAHRVNSGELPRWPARNRDDAIETDFFFVATPEPDQGVEMILRLVQERIPGRFGFDPWREIQVLTPMQRGELGARNLNQVLQAALNPDGPGVLRFGSTYRIGDKVMQIRNNYEKEVFNGDIGRIAALDGEEECLTVTYEDRGVRYQYSELDELVLSYAATVHKSQGSEYPCVVLPVHTQHYMLLRRNLLYTGITRGRKLVVLVGTEKAIALAVQREDARGRVTSLRERLTRLQR